MRKHSFVNFIVFLTLMLLVISGCTPAKKLTQKRPAPHYNVEPYPGKNPGTTIKDISLINDNLSKAVLKVKNVNKASVVILKTTAYAGVKLTAGLSKTEITKVKQNIRSVIVENEPRIRTVWLSDKPQTLNKIDKVRRDMKQGKSSSYYASNIRLIMQDSELIKK